MVYIRQLVECQSWQQPMDVLIIWLMLLIAHIEYGLTTRCQEHMGSDEHVVGIDAQVIAARSHSSAELQELLEQLSAAVQRLSVRCVNL